MTFLSSFTAVLVSDEDPKWKEVSQKYGIEGFPTVVFAKKDGTEVGRQVGAGDVGDFRQAVQNAIFAAQ